MFNLEFNVFWDFYTKHSRIKDEDRRILHYEEKTDKFILYIKSLDYWEYKTEISISKIKEFGGMYDTTEEQAIKDFKRSFLYDAVPINSPKEIIENLPESITKELSREDDEEDAENYADFLEKQFNRWEKKILGFIDETIKSEVVEKSYVEKSFGDFLQRLFNTVHVAEFLGKVEAIIKKTFKKGIEEAELEVNVDVGFDHDFELKVKTEARKQLDGFYIEGNHWYGIKGVSQDLQKKIREIVVDGINKKKGLTQIKNEIKDLMIEYKGGTKIDGKVTSGRAMKIAKTETTRYENEAKEMAYKKTRVVKGKKWNAHMDDRTCPICKGLDGQEVPLDEPFHYAGKEYSNPPSPHPSCSCSITGILK